MILPLLLIFSCNTPKKEENKKMIVDEIRLIKKEPTKENIARLLEKSKKIYKNGDEETAKKIWEELGKYDSEAFSCLADYYSDKNDEKNYEKYLLKAAEDKNERAMFNLGGLYQKRRNKNEMLKWYTKVIEKNGETSIIAMTNLGNYYDEIGQIDKMLYWYKRAAEKGSIDAMNNLGVYYNKNNQEKEMLYWYKKALEKDENITTLNNLAGYYFEKENLNKKDLEEAEKWYKRAAKKGSVDAMANLGAIYHMFEEYELAEEMYIRAINHGNKKSMYNLGVLYEDRALYTKAKEWYKKASELGDEEAMNKYNELKDKY